MKTTNTYRIRYWHGEYGWRTTRNDGSGPWEAFDRFRQAYFPRRATPELTRSENLESPSGTTLRTWEGIILPEFNIGRAVQACVEEIVD